MRAVAHLAGHILAELRRERSAARDECTAGADMCQTAPWPAGGAPGMCTSRWQAFQTAPPEQKWQCLAVCVNLTSSTAVANQARHHWPRRRQTAGSAPWCWAASAAAVRDACSCARAVVHVPRTSIVDVNPRALRCGAKSRSYVLPVISAGMSHVARALRHVPCRQRMSAS